MANAIERRLWLVRIIRRKGKEGLSLKDIQKLHESEYGIKYARSTFKRDVKEINESYGVNITCAQEREHSYYFITTLEQINDNTNSGAIINRLSEYLHIKSIIKERKELGEIDFGDRIQFEELPSETEDLDTIVRAMKDNMEICFDYQSFWEEEQHQIVLHPYFVKESQRRWYVIGQHVDSEEINNFCLDRITNLRLTANRFNVPRNFNYKLFYHNSYGVLKEKEISKVEIVRIKVWHEQVEYLRSLPIHHSQKEIKTKPDYSIFQFRILPTYDFKMEILSHGSSWEVLEPTWFRKDVATGFRMGYRLYYVDGRENNSEECQQIREMMTLWKNNVKQYSNISSVEFVDDIANPREPQIGLIVNHQYYIVIGYNDIDKLYYGIRYEDDSCSKSLSQTFDKLNLRVKLELTTDGWYGWHKTVPQDAINEFKNVLTTCLTLPG